MLPVTFKKWFIHTLRGVQIIALLCVVSSTFNTPIDKLLLDDAYAGRCTVTGAYCVGNGECFGGICETDPSDGPGNGTPNAPEMPALFLPLFLLASAGSFYAVRQRHLRVKI